MFGNKSYVPHIWSQHTHTHPPHPTLSSPSFYLFLLPSCLHCPPASHAPKFPLSQTSQRVAGCCRVLQCIAVCCSVLQCVAACCSVLQCVAVCARGPRKARVAGCCSVLQCVAVCCSVLQCVAVCCRVLQCVAVCCSVLQCALGDLDKPTSLYSSPSNSSLWTATLPTAPPPFLSITIRALVSTPVSHTHTRTNTQTHTHTQSHTHTHKHTRTRTHTHTQRNDSLKTWSPALWIVTSIFFSSLIYTCACVFVPVLLNTTHV